MNELTRRWLHWRHRHSPWHALLEPYAGSDWVALDLESTGLDPRRDEIISIAAIPLTRARINLSQRFECLVAPGRDFDIGSIRHHRIRPSELAAALPPRVAVERLLRWLGNRPLLGYHIDFDCALLDRHVPAITGFRLPNRRIDLMSAWAARERLARPTGDLDLRFERILGELGVPALARHTALGDALCTALAWCALKAKTSASNHRRERRGCRPGPSE